MRHILTITSLAVCVGKNHARKQIWSLSSGIVMADEADPNQQTLINSGSAASIPLAKTLKVKDSGKRYLSLGGLVLCFYGYFKEAVYESQLENYRIRHCEIMYFLEDDSISIVERKVENSGVPQGTFAKRHNIVKNEADETYYNLKDIVIGETIDVYGRSIFITDCNNSTRRYLVDKCGKTMEELVPRPGEDDVYTVMRQEFMSRETGRDEGVAHNIRTNPMKVFAEAQLGKTVNNNTREGFLQYGRTVLRFDCLWDDRESLYGDLMRFTLQYYLADDTMEVLTVNGPNNGRDPFKKMLKRGKLQKDRHDPDSAAWHWSDFSIGTAVDVYSKTFIIVEADMVSRKFYEEKGCPLSPPIKVQAEEQIMARRELPPYNGYGSEEDSLASCIGSLIGVAPKIKLGENKIMRFKAKMESKNPEDIERTFTVSFYLVDNTVQIHEPPKRNSGIVGGSFLSRMKLRTTEGLITQEYFYVGAEIQLAGHPFILVDADEGTLRHIDNSDQLFEFSNLNHILNIYRLSLGAVAESGELGEAFKEMDPGASGKVSMRDFKGLLMKFEASYYYGGPPEQAVITLCRKLGTKTELQYDKFMAALIDPSVLQGM